MTADAAPDLDALFARLRGQCERTPALARLLALLADDLEAVEVPPGMPGAETAPVTSLAHASRVSAEAVRQGIQPTF